MSDVTANLWQNYRLKQIIAITGHRPHKLGREYDGVGPYSDYVRQELEKTFTERQAKLVISGFALGVDQIAVEVAHSLGIDVFAAIPCDGQEKIWPKKSKEKYKQLLMLAIANVVVCPGGYEKWKMYARNRYMVDKAGVTVAVWNGTSGGTYDTVKYTREVEKELVIINPDGWKPKIEPLTLF